MHLPTTAKRLRRGLRISAAALVAGAALLGVAVPAQAASVVKMKVPQYSQQYADDCESTALRMILAYRGHNLTDAQILRQIGVDRTHWRFGVSGPTSGDPFRAFVGNPNGDEGKGTGFGVYYPRVAVVARANHLTVLAAGMNISPAYLYRELAAGHPAEVWIDYLYRHKTAKYYRAYDGRQILWAGPAEHAITLIGVTPKGVWVNDPARGSYWISKTKFEAGYATYHDMAVVVS